MRIAIISIKPASLTSGSEVRNYYIFHGLKKYFKVSYHIPSLPPLSQNNLYQRISLVLQNKIPYIEYLRKATFNKEEIVKIRNSDIIQFAELEAFYAFEKYLSDCNSKLVIDTHNIDYIRFKSEIENKGIIEKKIGLILTNKLKYMEINAIKKVDHLIVCSQNEKKYFMKFLPQNRITVIPNGVDIKNCKPSPTYSKNSILFMGSMSYPPNEQAIRYYIKEIHWKLLKIIPTITLTVIGKGSPLWLQDLSKKDKSIKLKGFVKDVRSYIKDACICICPIQYGSGTRLKILEYMAFAKPVVSTVKGAEGINVKNNKNILLADSPDDYVKSIERLINNKKLYNRISTEARKLITSQYDWHELTSQIIPLYKHLCEIN